MTKPIGERITDLKEAGEQDRDMFKHIRHNGKPVKTSLQLALEIIDELQAKLKIYDKALQKILFEEAPDHIHKICEEAKEALNQLNQEEKQNG